MRATGGRPCRELFAAFALQYVKVLAACANFPLARGYPKWGFAPAKTPSPEVYFFAAFAPLREVFRVLVAASLRRDQRDLFQRARKGDQI